ncbi:hypothetical protein MMC30_006303 [Trapelia coarctata]|nr:hypothetical protein [Trapelia coarctata]
MSSGIGEERWRNSRGQQPSSQGQGNQQRKQNAPRKLNSISQSSGKPTGESQEGAKGMSSGSAWGGNERGWTEGQKSPPEQQPAAATFKAQETREFLKRGIYKRPYRYEQIGLIFGLSAGYNGEGMKALRYKAPSGQAATKTGGSPWASRPNTMGSGKEFFLEFRKQISVLQQSERAGG